MSRTLTGSTRFAVVLVLLGVPPFLGGIVFGHIFSGFAGSPIVLSLVCLFALAGWVSGVCIAVRSLAVPNSVDMIPDRVRHSLDALAEGLLVTDEQERIVLANESFASMVGSRNSQLLGKRVGSLTWECSESADAQDSPWSRALAERTPQTEQLLRYRLADGSSRCFAINASPVDSPDSEMRGVLCTFRDVTESEQHRASLEHRLALIRMSRDEVHTKNRELEILATRDAMTGCLNRRAFFAELDALWRELDPDCPEVACLMIDCDHFKDINDQHGHQVGDDVLQLIAEKVAEAFPAPSLVCRYGGEEFCVVMPHHWSASAALDAEEFRQSIESIRFDAAPSLGLTVSIGVSDLRFDAGGPHELINQADKSLYLAKGDGRNRVVVYSHSASEQGDSTPSGQTPNEMAEIPFRAVNALLSALAYRDTATAEHSRRVADLCVRLASGLLDQRRIYLLEIAALLHDIGKIGVPDDVLLKPSSLTETEWALMRQHERIGLEIAAAAFSCDELNEILRTYRASYRSRPSESHLPDGNDIPLPARLLAVADSYDAMVSKRVFREPRTHQEALEELRCCAGSQFDPVLVEHFATTIPDPGVSTELPGESLSRQTAIQFGLQIERIADALDARDAKGLQGLAGRLGSIARRNQIESIALAAEKIESDVASEEQQWMELLRDTQRLLRLCRLQQDALLRQQVDGISRRDPSC